jgi:hypothetical protein
MWAMIRSSWGLGQALLALTVAAACGSAPPTVATNSASASRTESSPTITVLDDTFGFVLNKVYDNYPIPGPVGLKVRRESDPQPVFELGIKSPNGINVSPDGRHAVYWSDNELRHIDIAPNAVPRTLFAVPTNESALYIAWSGDGTGIVIGVNGGGAGFADAPPGYTALRVVDVAGGQAREIIRVPNISVLPLSWDRQAHLIAAYQPSSSGARSYYLIDEAGTLVRSDAGPGLYQVEANGNGQQVLGHGDPGDVLRVWPRASYVAGTELRSAGGERILDAHWRPGTAEIGVLFEDRIELWDVGGAHRILAVLPLPSVASASRERGGSVRGVLFFRADGNAVFINRQIDFYPDLDAVAVDLASGRTALLAGLAPEPSVFVGR